MDVNIVRSAVRGDAGPIAEIFDHFVLNTNLTFKTTPRPPSDWSARIKSAEASSHPFIVAATDGRVVGYAYADTWRSTAVYRFTVENTVYVHPDFAGHGLGRLLLSELIARCTEAGFRRMIADVGNPASVGLHESLGFVEVGTLTGVGFKHDQWIDTILMQHELSSRWRSHSLLSAAVRRYGSAGTIKSPNDSAGQGRGGALRHRPGVQN